MTVTIATAIRLWTTSRKVIIGKDSTGRWTQRLYRAERLLTGTRRICNPAHWRMNVSGGHPGDNAEKILRLQACAPHQSAIHILNRQQLGGVRRLHRAAVEN